MGVKVYIPLPEGGRWGGACGVWRGFQVFVYDTDRVRPNGSDDPTSKNYKYYPAEGAVVVAKFYDDKGWSTTVRKTIPTHQPVGEDIAWVYVGTVIPCDICNGRKDFFVSVDVDVYYKGYKWSKSFPNLIYVSCPYEGNPEFIVVRSSDISYSNGTISAEFWLEQCGSNSFRVPISLYKYSNGKYVMVERRFVTLYKNRKVRVSFSVESGIYGIAVTKAGTNYADKSWVCGNRWTIRL